MCIRDRIFELCVEKGSELPEGDPARKFKGRSVFQGNQVKDENWNNAMFAELGSSPAALQAAKLVDAYGLLPGHTTEQADAEMAYINANLEGTPTYVRLPPNRVPAAHKHVRDPVYRLVKALYGHPDSGGYWERYAHDVLVKGGWKLISPSSWRSTYWHDKFKCFMIVYVDDFKLSGPCLLYTSPSPRD